MLPTSNSSGGSGWKTVWSEPKLNLVGNGKFDSAQGTVAVSKLQVDSESLQVELRGAISELTERCVLDVQGDIAYDSAALAALLHAYEEGDDATGLRTQKQGAHDTNQSPWSHQNWVSPLRRIHADEQEETEETEK